jgi:hypothetical protein
MSPAHLQLGATEIKVEKMPSEDGASEGDTTFRETTDTPTWRDALVSIDNDGHFVGGILRPLDYPVHEEEGRRSDPTAMNNSGPAPYIGDTRIRLLRSRVFSSIDDDGTNHVVKTTKKEDGLSTPWGAWQSKPRPVPLATALATGGRLMQKVLHDISSDLPQPYIDDICIHSSDLPLRFVTLGRVGDYHPFFTAYNQRDEPGTDGTETQEGEASEAPLNSR